jgi:hypothetical protein
MRNGGVGPVGWVDQRKRDPSEPHGDREGLRQYAEGLDRGNGRDVGGEATPGAQVQERG